MARNKTKAWLINRSISFERCAPDVCPTPCGETLWQRRHTSTTEHLTTLWGGRAHMKRQRTCYGFSRVDRAKKTDSLPPKVIRLQMLRADQIEEGPGFLREITETPSEGPYWLSRRIRIDKHLSHLDTTQEEGEMSFSTKASSSTENQHV